MPSDMIQFAIPAIQRGGSQGSTAARQRQSASDHPKRACDIAISLTILVLLSPLMAIIALLVAMDGGNVFYSHPRIGRDGRPFGCLKFRTMILGAMDALDEYLEYNPEERQEWQSSRKLTFDPRTTAIGRLLRETSLDELPQLLNVLRGEMSLVGPRPVTASELALYGDAARLTLSVRPGITGPWQIGGRNDLSYARRVELDAQYVMHRNFLGDLAILLRTPRAVFSRAGAR